MDFTIGEIIAILMIAEAILILALTEILRRTFVSTEAYDADQKMREKEAAETVTRSEFNGLGERFSAIEKMFVKYDAVVDEMRNDLTQVRADQQAQSQRIAESVIKPLERMTNRLEAIADTQARQAQTLDILINRVSK